VPLFPKQEGGYTPLLVHHPG